MHSVSSSEPSDEYSKTESQTSAVLPATTAEPTGADENEVANVSELRDLLGDLLPAATPPRDRSPDATPEETVNLRALLAPASAPVTTPAAEAAPTAPADIMPEPKHENGPTGSSSPSRTLALILLAVLIVITATITAYLASNAKQRVYGGRIELLFNTESYDSESEFDRALATQREILRSEPIVGPAARAAGMSPKQLQKALTVERVGQSEVLRVTVGDRSRTKARSLAQAVATNFLQRVAQAPPADGATTTRFLNGRLEELTVTLDRTTARLRELEISRGAVGSPVAEELRLREEVADLVRQIGSVREQVLALELSRMTSSDVSTLAPARQLESPIEPKPKQAAVEGFLVGSVLAAGTVYLIQYLARRQLEKRERSLAAPESHIGL